MKIAMFGIKGIPVPAGAENVVEQIGSRLVQRGHEVTVYVRPHYTPREMKEYKGMKLVHLPSIPTKNLDAITHSFLASIAVLREGADIVHVHSTGNSIFAFLPRIWGMKTIVQSHGLDWQREKWGRLAKFYLRMSDYSTIYFPNSTTAVSKKMTKYYQALTNRKVVYIPNGVAPAERRSAELLGEYGLDGDDYVLFAARFVPEKGAHYLLEAFQRIDTPYKLVMAGDGAYGNRYADEIKTQASERIIFPGFVRGELFEAFLSNARLFVLPSDIEGLSTGLLEAMSYANCVLASDIEENLEALGDIGYTFKAGSVDDLEDKLRTLLAKNNLRQTCGKLARDYVHQCFDWDIVTSQFEELYSSLLTYR